MEEVPEAVTQAVVASSGVRLDEKLEAR